ncbi:MAG: transcription antitermination factor NusB [Lachnospiraceae bacterium]|nr:transcription antitermination factor NusB [Lachnospiraceae bacterium]MBP5653180.1 transcription antitermination factor NusB [Lachnospiraceae bacterium]
MTRRNIREHLIKLLYIRDFHEAEEFEEQENLYFSLFTKLEHPTEDIVPVGKDLPEVSDADLQYIRERYDSIISRLGEIDHILEVAMSGWTINRVSKLELAILRVAVYEMKFDDDIPPKVAIDEAVELAKIYGSKDTSYGFVNGILAKIL